MCGIFFTINNETTTQSKIGSFLSDAFYASQVRGVDGSGLAIVGGKTDEDKEHPFFYKSQVPATEFLTNEEVKKALVRAGDSKLAIGHVRAATHGEVTSANAHPFKVTRDDKSYIIGVHNGTLNNWKSSASAKGFDVDSKWALWMIAQHGIDAFEYFTGAFAFVWYDSRTPDKVYMCRNDQRPLHFMIDTTRKLLVGASEPGMLGWLAERNRIIVGQDKNNAEEFYSLTSGHLFTIDFNTPDRWEVAKLPSYNYLKLFPSAVSTSYMGNPAYGYRRNRHDYDQLWGGHQVTSRYNYYSDEGKQDRVIGEVKDILSDARSTRYKKAVAVSENEIVDSDEWEKKLTEAIQESLKEKEIGNDDPFGAFVQSSGLSDKKIVIPSEMISVGKPYYLSNPLDGTATKGEIQEARKRRIYGQVVRFLPVHYEPSDQALLGDFEMVIDGKRIKAVGEIRYDITGQKAHSLISEEMPILVSVVGAGDLGVPAGYAGKDDVDDDVYVLANLTQAQRDAAFKHLYH